MILLPWTKADDDETTIIPKWNVSRRPLDEKLQGRCFWWMLPTSTIYDLHDLHDSLMNYEKTWREIDWCQIDWCQGPPGFSMDLQDIPHCQWLSGKKGAGTAATGKATTAPAPPRPPPRPVWSSVVKPRFQPLFKEICFNFGDEII